jgi:hypothetical protein
LYTNVHWSLSHKTQKIGTTQIFLNRWMNKQMLFMYTYSICNTYFMYFASFILHNG